MMEFKIKTNKEEQNDIVFNYCKYSTFLFILNLFNKSLNEDVFIPSFTHNAIPVNLNDIKEMYDIIYKSNYKYPTLDCRYRNVEGLQFEIFMLSYTFLKYDRKIKNIPCKYINLNDSINENYYFPLFCINKGAGNYSNLKLYQAKIVMEYLFPNPSSYEIVDYSSLNLPFNYTHLMNEKIKYYENKNFHMITKREFLYFEGKLILVFILTFFKIIKREK